MNIIPYEIQTLAPVLLAGGPPAGNLTTTLDHIPGSVILGVLARRYIERSRDTGDRFSRVFLKGGAVFDHAYIEGALPVPLSARTCKYADGFYEPGGAHGVVDMLLSGEDEIRCPQSGKGCKHPIDYFTGYYLQADHGPPPRFARRWVMRRVITRTAISATFGTAAPARLYSLEAIEEGQVFKGRICVREEHAGIFSELMDKPFEACIGKGSSRGLGWVRIRPCGPFDTPIGQARDRAPAFRSRDGRQLLVATLLSDAFFCDDFLRDVTLPGIEHIAPAAGLDAAQWEPDAAEAFADTRLVHGFQGRPWRLPRVPRLAVTAGSVIAFRARAGGPPGLPPGDGLIRVGERTAEGYGRALLFSPFHAQLKAGGEA